MINYIRSLHEEEKIEEYSLDTEIDMPQWGSVPVTLGKSTQSFNSEAEDYMEEYVGDDDS